MNQIAIAKPMQSVVRLESFRRSIDRTCATITCWMSLSDVAEEMRLAVARQRVETIPDCGVLFRQSETVNRVLTAHVDERRARTIIAYMLDCFPNARSFESDAYIDLAVRLLVGDEGDFEPTPFSAAVVLLAVTAVVLRQKFVPTISELFDAMTEVRDRFRDTSGRLDRLRELRAEAEEYLIDHDFDLYNALFPVGDDNGFDDIPDGVMQRGLEPALPFRPSTSLRLNAGFALATRTRPKQSPTCWRKSSGALTPAADPPSLAASGFITRDQKHALIPPTNIWGEAIERYNAGRGWMPVYGKGGVSGPWAAAVDRYNAELRARRESGRSE